MQYLVMIISGLIIGFCAQTLLIRSKFLDPALRTMAADARIKSQKRKDYIHIEAIVSFTAHMWGYMVFLYLMVIMFISLFGGYDIGNNILKFLIFCLFYHIGSGISIYFFKHTYDKLLDKIFGNHIK